MNWRCRLGWHRWKPVLRFRWIPWFNWQAHHFHDYQIREQWKKRPPVCTRCGKRRN